MTGRKYQERLQSAVNSQQIMNNTQLNQQNSFVSGVQSTANNTVYVLDQRQRLGSAEMPPVGPRKRGAQSCGNYS